MTQNRRLIWYGTLFVGGAVLFILGVLGYADSTLSGVGGGLVGVAAVRLAQAWRFAHDPQYAQRVEVSNTDERNVFLATKSANMSFRLSVIALAIASVALRPLGYPEAATVLGLAMMLQITLYWVTYLVMSRTY